MADEREPLTLAKALSDEPIGASPSDGRVFVPFTPEQVANLNTYQVEAMMHPFTHCWDKSDPDHCGADLLAAEDGWHCPNCPMYTQHGAFAFMADGSATEAARRFRDLLTEQLP